MRNAFKFFASITLFANLLTFAGENPNSKITLSDPDLKTFMFFIEDAAGKIIQLAEAMPQEKFSWRPGEGVRSMSEVFMHIAGSNYFLASKLGVAMPQNAVSQEMEKTVTDKEQVISHLKNSFEFMKSAVLELKNENLDDEVEMPFGKFSKRVLKLLLLVHCNEHLGQSIAYARTNGVKPPWSE